jgi:hypothetical protein
VHLPLVDVPLRERARLGGIRLDLGAIPGEVAEL